MKLFILIVTMSFMVLSCKKGKADFTLKGVITDLSFNSGLSGATIKLYEVEAGGGAINLIGTTNVSDGNYSFTFPRNKVESYQLIVEKQNYFDFNETVYFADLTISEDNIRNFSITAKSWVNLHFVNTNPSPTDQLQYIRTQGKKDCEECCPTNNQMLTGAVDTNIYCINDGNTIYSYDYWVIGMGINGTKSITTIPFDTVELLLNY